MHHVSNVTEQWSMPVNTRRYEIELPGHPEFIHGQSKYRASHVTLGYTWTNREDSITSFWTLYVNQIRLGHISPRVGKLHPNDFRNGGVPDWLDDIVERGKPRLG